VKVVEFDSVTGVVAVNAAAHGHPSVSIRAGEIRPQADLVDASAESLAQNTIEGVIALAASWR
jgi:hypothetical protein